MELREYLANYGTELRRIFRRVAYGYSGLEVVSPCPKLARCVGTSSNRRQRAFLVQVPPILLAILLVQWRLHLPVKNNDVQATKWDKLKRVDFIGASFLCLTIFTACFVMDAGGSKYAWNSPILISIMAVGVLSAVLFVVSAKRVNEPIFPLRLMAQYSLITNYLIVMLQIMVQMSLMMSVPIYFQATKNANTAEAGAYLVPAFVGNTLGGLLAGYWIRKTGLYKWPTIMAPVLSVGSLLLCLLDWNGHTSVLQSLYIFPGGFATGMISSSAFVGMAAGIDHEDIAVAGSGMYLFFSIGAIAGSSAGATVYQNSLQSGLRNALRGVEGRKKVCRTFAKVDMKLTNNLRSFGDYYRI